MTADIPLDDQLIEAWEAWEATPGARAVVMRKLDLLRELGMPSIAAHVLIARMRREGYDVPSAVQTAVNELSTVELWEAS